MRQIPNTSRFFHLLPDFYPVFAAASHVGLKNAQSAKLWKFDVQKAINHCTITYRLKLQCFAWMRPFQTISRLRMGRSTHTCIYKSLQCGRPLLIRGLTMGLLLEPRISTLQVAQGKTPVGTHGAYYALSCHSIREVLCTGNFVQKCLASFHFPLKGRDRYSGFGTSFFLRCLLAKHGHQYWTNRIVHFSWLSAPAFSVNWMRSHGNYYTRSDLFTQLPQLYIQIRLGIISLYYA